MRCINKYETLFSFGKNSFFQDTSVKIFISCLYLENSLGRLKLKSSRAMRLFFYSTLNQHSSQEYKSFFVSLLISSHPRSIRMDKKFYAWSAFISKFKKDYANKRKLFRVIFWGRKRSAWAWNVHQVNKMFTTFKFCYIHIINFK